jgi:hypothetical protein
MAADGDFPTTSTTSGSHEYGLMWVIYGVDMILKNIPVVGSS